MWTDFSEVRTRACMLISGEREIRANELGLSLFLPVVGRRLLCSFFLSFFDLDTADVFATSTSSKTKKKKKQCIRDTDDPRKCKALRDDYLECLHHRKEIARLNTVYREQKKADAAAAANKGGAAAAAAEKKH